MATFISLFLLLSSNLFALPQGLNEEEKINKLISFVEQQKGSFIRNGSEYTPKEAAAHLRMKREKAGSRIKTALQFIQKIASESSLSGTPYRFRYLNGKEVLVNDMLLKELQQIEKGSNK